MKNRVTPFAVAVLAVGLAACSASTSSGTDSSSTASAPAQSAPAPSASAPATAPSAPAAVAAVPGTDNNEYVTGPFTVTLKGIEPYPSTDDTVNEQGQPVAEKCAEVDVKNTSNSFTGLVAPQVEFVKGHSVTGQVLETDPAGSAEPGGLPSDSSDTLAPGQSEALYSCPQSIPAGTYVEAQLTEVDYSTPSEGTAGGTGVQLKY